jgi:hypothetical protein
MSNKFVLLVNTVTYQSVNLLVKLSTMVGNAPLREINYLDDNGFITKDILGTKKRHFLSFQCLTLSFFVFFLVSVSACFGVFLSCLLAHCGGSRVSPFSGVILPGAGGLLQAIAGGVYLVAAFTLSRPSPCRGVALSRAGSLRRG